MRIWHELRHRQTEHRDLPIDTRPLGHYTPSGNDVCGVRIRYTHERAKAATALENMLPVLIGHTRYWNALDIDSVETDDVHEGLQIELHTPFHTDDDVREGVLKIIDAERERQLLRNP